MITAEKMKELAKTSEDYIQKKGTIWTIRDTIELKIIEKIIEANAKKGNTGLNYFHNIRPNVRTHLEEAGFHFLNCNYFWEITWGGQYKEGEEENVECS